MKMLIMAAGLAVAVASFTTAQAQSRYPYAYGEQHGWRGGDNVGSIVRTPGRYSYGYNRFSGQRYYKCEEDLGYGRTRPCDAGGGGGG